MSADNYYLIRRDKKNKEYVVEMRFASDEYSLDEPFDEHSKRFKTLNEAEVYAHSEYSEYGVQCEFPVLHVSLPVLDSEEPAQTLHDLLDVWDERAENVHNGTTASEILRCREELRVVLSGLLWCAICDAPFQSNNVDRRVCNVCMDDEIKALAADM